MDDLDDLNIRHVRVTGQVGYFDKDRWVSVSPGTELYVGIGTQFDYLFYLADGGGYRTAVWPKHFVGLYTQEISE